MGPMELEDFGDALDALVSSGAQHYGDGASIEVLHRELARFEAFVTEATGAFEGSEEWAADGAKTAAAWCSRRFRTSSRGSPRETTVRATVKR